MMKKIQALMFFAFLAAEAFGGDPGVILYNGADYSGDSEVIFEDVANLRHSRIGNDLLCAIRVPRGCEITLYEHSHYRGRAVTLRRSEPRLSDIAPGFGVSSIRVAWLWDGEPHSREYGVTLFSRPDFQGDAMVFEGDAPNLARTAFGGDRVSSLAVPPGYSATLYEHRNYRGRSITIHRDEVDLAWTSIGRNRVSSIRVFYRGAPTGPPVYEPSSPHWESAVHVGLHLLDDEDEDVLAVAAGALLAAGVIHAASERERIPGPGVTLYQGPGFVGQRQTFNRHVKRFRNTQLGNDIASSIDIPHSYEVTLYEHDRFRGKSITLRGSLADLGRTELGDNAVSSMVIRYIGE